MKKSKWKIGKEYLWITGIVFLIFLGISLCFPAFFYLNDDVTIRSILSGGYTGMPNGHGVYMKYPLTGILSMLYRITNKIPWFSFMMAGCFIISVSAIVCYTWKNVREKGKKQSIFILFMVSLFCIAFILPQYLYQHYTIVASFVGGAALFIVMVDSKEQRSVVVPIVLLMLCFCIRSQVFYLLLPFLGVVLLSRIIREGIKKQFVFLAAFACCYMFCMITNSLFYTEWYDYEEYNDNRTLLYDYADLLPYTEYEDSYKEIGVTKEQYDILASYNLALDSSIDAKVLEDVAQIFISKRSETTSSNSRWKNSIIDYYYYVRQSTPYNYIVLLGYLLVFFCFLWRRDALHIFLLFCLGAGRSMVWVYLIWKGRFPERIYTSLYLIELFLLLGMFLWSITCELKLVIHKREKNSQGNGIFYLTPSFMVTVCTILMLTIVVQWTSLYPSITEQKQRQKEWQALKEYCISQRENLYLLDVYSVASYGDKVFAGEVTYENYKLAGGWMTKTPFLEETFQKIGVNDGGEALVFTENVFFVIREDKDLTWLEEYINTRFGQCNIELTATVTVEDAPLFLVYTFHLNQ